jgi:EAL domain-containing protein (putative c-di-GMP-specific phosphodiesterase class I)
VATLFSNQAHLANIIDCYKKQGFSKAIDDFGSGIAGGVTVGIHRYEARRNW